MGASETKEAPRNVTFENQILMTEAALQQLQASVGKSVPQTPAGTPTSTSTPVATPTTPFKPSTNTPLPKIDATETVETWRALASSVNDRELQRLRDEYKKKLLEQDRINREKWNLTKENLAAEVEKVEKKFPKFNYTPICELERADIEQCYLANPKQVLTCSNLAEKFIKCVHFHREQSFRSSQPTSTSNTGKENREQHEFADSLSAKTSAKANDS